ncbi:hypothetical protein QX776_12070 [Alteromonadaceae bacterium BrNp21-10]|nr:hypothetical protein [Alteromonadaceae bacterium BrNp21-10]
MSEIRNHPFLITFLLLLICIKYVLHPVVEWQNDKLWSIAQNNKRQIRAAEAIANVEANQVQIQTYKQQKKILQSMFYKPMNEAEFKLEQQQWLEELVDQYGFKINNVGWTYSVKMLSKPVITHRLSLNFEGQTYELPAFHLALAANPEWIGVETFSVDTIGQREESLGKFRATMDVVFYQMESEAGGQELYEE